MKKRCSVTPATCVTPNEYEVLRREVLLEVLHFLGYRELGNHAEQIVDMLYGLTDGIAHRHHEIAKHLRCSCGPIRTVYCAVWGKVRDLCDKNYPFCHAYIVSKRNCWHNWHEESYVRKRAYYYQTPWCKLHAFRRMNDQLKIFTPGNEWSWSHGFPIRDLPGSVSSY